MPLDGQVRSDDATDDDDNDFDSNFFSRLLRATPVAVTVWTVNDEEDDDDDGGPMLDRLLIGGA